MGKKSLKCLLKDFNRFTKNDFRFHVDCEYDTIRACQTGSDCCKDDYCRCGQIVNAHVPMNVNHSYKIALKATKNQGLIKDFRFYCLERLISCLLRENPHCFDVSVSGGYYGEEIYGVNLSWEILSVINYFIDELNKRKSASHYKDLVEKVLTREYGYVLPAIVNKVWEYEQVLISNIKLGNDEYHGKDTCVVSQYAEKYPRDGQYLSCLCKRINEKEYVLVDGYHRYAAAVKCGDKNMMVMWCNV